MWGCCTMLTLRSCFDCGRQVRLSVTIQPPRCPACRLARLPAPLETRPCLRCRIQIPINSSDLHCRGCQARRASDVTCRDCGNPFPARPHIIRCPACRARRSTTIRAPIDFSRLHSTSFDPFVNSFQRSDPHQQICPRTLPSTSPPTQSTQSVSMSFVINQGISFLRREYESRVHASHVFPPQISPSHIRISIARFENDMAIASRDATCSSCGKLVPSHDIRQFLDRDPLLQPLEGFLDICGRSNGFWNLCSMCHAALLRGSVPKFSAKNNVNITLCQDYPCALKDLTLTEEYLVAKSHPVGVVIKLRPGGQTSPANYHALRGHFIIIP